MTKLCDLFPAASATQFLARHALAETANPPSDAETAAAVPLVEEDLTDGGQNAEGTGLLQLLATPRLEEFDLDLVEEVEVFSVPDFHQTVLWMEYLLNVATSLDEAKHIESRFTHTAAFLHKYFNSNAWLRYSSASLTTRQRLVEQVQATAARKDLSSGAKEELVARMLADLLLRELLVIRPGPITDGRHAPSLDALQPALVNHIITSGAAQQAIAGLNRVETTPLHTWTDSLWQSPLLTLTNILANAFNSALRGFQGITEREIDHHCGIIASKTQHILPLSHILPGGVLGRIIHAALRVHLTLTQPSMAHLRGTVALALAYVCKNMSGRLVQQLSMRYSQIRNTALQSATMLLNKYLHLRGDVVAQKLTEKLLRGEGARMLARLFQLHSVNIEGHARRGEDITSAMFQDAEAYAGTEGLLVGARDFGHDVHKHLSTYISVATELVLLCNGEPSSGEVSVEHINELLNINENPELTPEQRLALWCSLHMEYVKRLEFNVIPMAEAFMDVTVKTLKYEFKFFKGHLSKLLTLLYESAHLLINQEVDVGGTITRSYPGREYAATFRRMERIHQAPGREMGRAMFRIPWMKKALQDLASGLIESCAALSMLETLGEGRFDVRNRDAVLAYSRAYKQLNNGSKCLSESYKSLFGKLVTVQSVLTALKTSQYQRFAELFKEDVSAAEVRFRAEFALSELKFVANSLFALNVGVTSPTTSLPAASLFDESTEHRARMTLAFRNWGRWLQRHGATKGNEGAALLAFSACVDSEEKVRPLTEALRGALVSRLRFPRFEMQSQGILRLYDDFGQSALFKPQSPSDMIERMSLVPPSSLQTHATFIISEGCSGSLCFSQRPDLKIQGSLTFAEDYKGQLPLQVDPIATKQLLVAELIGPAGRISAEAIANVLMLLHQRLPVFRRMTFAAFLRQVTPKMLLDASIVLRPSNQKMLHEPRYMTKGSLYTFPFDLRTLRTILGTAASVTLTRMHMLSTTGAWHLSAYSALHAAYYSIFKRHTGRTAVLALFQQELLYTHNRLRTAPVEVSLPECSFLVEPDDQLEVQALKCAVYRFAKIRSLDITQATSGTREVEQVVTYINAVVRYLDHARGITPWKTFLRFQDYTATAKEYAATTATYTFQNLEEELQDGLMTTIPDGQERQAAPRPSTEAKRPDTRQTGKSPGFWERLWGRVKEASTRVGVTILKKYYHLKHKMFKIAGHESIPEMVRVVDVLNSSHFLGALESAEAELTITGGSAPVDLLSATEMESFAPIKKALDRTSVLLQSPRQMAAVLERIQTLPFVTASNNAMLTQVEERVKQMDGPDIEAAAGYLLATGIGKGMPGPALFDALQALAHPEYGRAPVPNQEKIDLLKMLEPAELAVILKALKLVIALKLVDSMPPQVAAKHLDFDPQTSMSVKWMRRTTFLPLYTRVNFHATIPRLKRMIMGVMLAKRLSVRDEMEACEQLYHRLIIHAPADNSSMTNLFPEDVAGGYMQMWVACALYLLLTNLQREGTAVTVEDLLSNLQYMKNSVMERLQTSAKAASYTGEAFVESTGPVGTLLKVLYTAITGTTTCKPATYKRSTGHIKYENPGRKVLTGATLYETCRSAMRYVCDNCPDTPATAEIRFGRERSANWLRFIREDVLNNLVEDYEQRRNFQNVPPTRLRDLSSVYTTSEMFDRLVAVQRISSYSPGDIVGGAVQRLLAKESGTSPAFGPALMLIGLNEQVRAALEDGRRIAMSLMAGHSSMQPLEMRSWELEVARERLLTEEYAGRSTDNLSTEEAHMILEAIEEEISSHARHQWETLRKSDFTIRLLRRRIIEYLRLPMVSYNSTSCLLKNLKMAVAILEGFRKEQDWTEVQRKLEQEGEMSRSYSSLERITLAEANFLRPNLHALDLLNYILTRNVTKPPSRLFRPVAWLMSWWRRTYEPGPPSAEFERALEQAQLVLAQA